MLSPIKMLVNVSRVNWLACSVVHIAGFPCRRANIACYLNRYLLLIFINHILSLDGFQYHTYFIVQSHLPEGKMHVVCIVLTK